MAWLHENREEFFDAVNLAAERFGVLPDVVEKDYYVTMMLRGLSEKLSFVVFKGGTSLSKCHKVINRFSEDIDITTDMQLTQGQKKKLKTAIVDVTSELGLTISNLDGIRSRAAYNCYRIAYDSVLVITDGSLSAEVKLETSFSEVSFPTVVLPIHSYVGDMMAEEAPGVIDEYGLTLFEMKVQGINRTLADKVFALCDYYIQGKTTRHSRHVYDIYKLLPLVPQTEEFKKLVREVRTERAKTTICPSAMPGVNIPETLRQIIEHEIYRNDYNALTTRLLEEPIPYDAVIEALKSIAVSDMFVE